MGHSRDEICVLKMPKHLQNSQDIRVLLAEYILNFEFPRFLLIMAFVLYITMKLFRFSIRVATSLLRPIIFMVLILIALPYLYEMKTGVTSNRVVSNVYTHTEGIVQNVYNAMNSVYLHTVRFYTKNF